MSTQCHKRVHEAKDHVIGLQVRPTLHALSLFTPPPAWHVFASALSYRWPCSFSLSCGWWYIDLSLLLHQDQLLKRTKFEPRTWYDTLSDRYAPCRWVQGKGLTRVYEEAPLCFQEQASCYVVTCPFNRGKEVVRGLVQGDGTKLLAALDVDWTVLCALPEGSDGHGGSIHQVRLPHIILVQLLVVVIVGMGVVWGVVEI